MPRLKKPSIKQKLTFDALLESIRGGKPLTMQKAMIKGGYSPITALNPELNLLSKDGFQKLLERIDDSVLLATVMDILHNGANRERLTAANTMFDLKGRFPDKSTKIIGLFQTIESLMEDKKDEKD